MANTQVTHDEIAVHGSLSLTNQRNPPTTHWSTFTWGLVTLGIFRALHPWAGLYVIEVGDVPVDGGALPPGGNCSYDFAINASDFRINRTRSTELRMGSDVGPTHSNESVFTDVWETVGPGTLDITFGEAAHNGPNLFGALPVITPASGFGINYEMDTTGAVEEIFSTLVFSSTEYDYNFGAIGDPPWALQKGMYLEGTGNKLEFKHYPIPWPPVIDSFINGWLPPRVFNLGKIKIGNWGAV